MRQFFIFQGATDPAWPRAKKVCFWIWNLGMVLASGVGIGLASMFLAVGPYSLRIIFGYFECPLIALLNLLPLVAMVLLIYGLSGVPQISFVITASVMLGFSVVNYYKIMFRNDPLMFADLLLIREMRGMMGNYRLFLDWKLVVVIACCVGGFFFLRTFVLGRPRRRGRIACTIAGAALLIAVFPALLNDTVYNEKTVHYDRLSSSFSATQQYLSRGFIYPFFHSIADAVEMPPSGYSEDKAEDLLAGYTDADIPEDQKVNIVGIMLEAYNDFTKFGVPELSFDVYQVWHELEAEGYSGDLVTNIFAGGTVDTERCFLTGYSTLSSFRGRTNSYVWYFRSQGYTVEGMHPCYNWFYNRANINANLGFENYYFVEDYFGELTGGNVAMDSIFIPELMKTYAAATAGGKPYFNFSVSYQGHGPYDTNVCWWGDRGSYVVDDGTYSDAEQYILDNYFGSIYDTNQHLKELTDYLREDDKPVILILFGDHNPWMGDGNSVYQAMGLNLDLSTEEGFYNYYATRYIIWANDAAKAVLGNGFAGEGPAVSPGFLMNEVFRLCGWEGPAYLQAVGEVMGQVPVINIPTGLCQENGAVTDQLTPEGQALVDNYNILQYYWRRHFAYSDLT